MYALHPGHVLSKHDGQVHFISAPQLIRLYGLKPGEYVVMKDSLPHPADRTRYVHLGPRYHGDYRGFLEQAGRA